MLNRLVWSCYTKKTSHRESALGVSVMPLAGEKILFFCTDSPDGRKSLEIPNNEPIADVVVFHRGFAAAPTLVIVELKGGDFSKAISQIKRTYESLKRMFPIDAFPQPKPIVALIVSACSCPPNKNRLEKQLGYPEVRLVFKSGKKNKDVDLREFLKN